MRPGEEENRQSERAAFGSCAHLLPHEREPPAVLRQLPADGLIERLLDAARHRARGAAADGGAVHLADRRDFDRGAGEESSSAPSTSSTAIGATLRLDAEVARDFQHRRRASRP